MSIDVNRLGPSAQRQILQKLTGQKKESKYHSTPAQRMMPNGKIRTFSSQKEARRYDELRAAMRAGVIRDLRIQPSFTLQESYVTPDGDLVRAIKYVADFSYIACTEPEKYVVEDVKGVRTEGYKLKWKMMQDKLGISVKEV